MKGIKGTITTILIIFCSSFSEAQQVFPPKEPIPRKVDTAAVRQAAIAERAEIMASRKRDSTYIAHATTYLNKKLDSEFVKKNLKLVKLYHHAGPIIAVYETTTTKNLEGRNTMILYFKQGTNEVDTVLSVFNKKEIMKSINGDSNCTLYIGIEKATEIAKEFGVKQGIKPWAIDISDAWPKQIPKWCIGAIYSISKAGDSGATVNINMTDGKHAPYLITWHSEPDGVQPPIDKTK